MSCLKDAPGGECSNHGHCMITNGTATCLCIYPWNGYGDFISRVDPTSGSDLDCQTNDRALTAFIIIALICRCTMLLFCMAKFMKGFHYVIANKLGVCNAIVTYPGRFYLLVAAECILVITMASRRIQHPHDNLIGYSAFGNICFSLWLELWSWFVFDVTLSQIRLAINLIRFDTNRSSIITNVINGLQPFYWTAQIIGTITQLSPLLYFDRTQDNTTMTIIVISAWLLCMGTHVITFQFIVTRILSALGHASTTHECEIAEAARATTPFTSCGQCVQALSVAVMEKKMLKNYHDVRYGHAIKRLVLSHRSLGRALVVSIFLIIALSWPYLRLRLNYVWWISLTCPFQGVLGAFLKLVRWPHTATAPHGGHGHGIVPGSPNINGSSGSHTSGHHGAPPPIYINGGKSPTVPSWRPIGGAASPITARGSISDPQRLHHAVHVSHSGASGTLKPITSGITPSPLPLIPMPPPPTPTLVIATSTTTIIAAANALPVPSSPISPLPPVMTKRTMTLVAQQHNHDSGGGDSMDHHDPMSTMNIVSMTTMAGTGAMGMGIASGRAATIALLTSGRHGAPSSSEHDELVIHTDEPIATTTTTQ